MTPFAAVLPLLATVNCTPSPTHTYDVIVVGAGTSGISAAIQAARRPGTSVALLEEGSVIGGQIVAAGVTSIDGGIVPPVSISGLYADYRTRVHEFYDALGLTANTCYDTSVDNTCSEPRVSRDIFEQMLAVPVPPGSNLCRFEGQAVTAVTKVGDRVTGLVTTSAGTPTTWTSHVVIDATEYGDVIPLTGAVYRIGKRLNTEPPDPFNCIDDITWIAVIRQYGDPGDKVPPELVMPESARDDARANEFHTLVGQDLWPGVCPSDSVSDWPSHQAQRGMPDSSPHPPDPSPTRTRTGVNYPNDYPGYYRWCPPPPNTNPYIWRGLLSTSFLEDPSFRQAQMCAAKLRTLQFLHYMQRNGQLGPPTWGPWAIADDEGYDSPNTCPSLPADLLPFERLLPPMPYVRESRRILSVDTLTGAEISRPGGGAPSLNRMPRALALGDYPPDQHNCRVTNGFAEPDEDLVNLRFDGGAFQIPFETFIPQVVDGFLPAEKNLGYTRAAASASRLQPSTMLVGQAAGAIAALAAKGYTPARQPRDVRVLDVQRELLSSGAATSLDTFSDVPKGHERWADAQLVSTYDIMTDFTPESAPGVYTFRVGDSVGRAAAAVALVRAFRIPTTGSMVQTFQDVPPSHPQFAQIEAMVAQGFDMSGCYLGPDYFCPDFALTRPQLARWLAHARWGTALPPPGPQLFSDVPPTHPYYQEIQAVANEGLMFACVSWGMPQFCVGTTATRGEVAQSLAQVLYKYPALWP